MQEQKEFIWHTHSNIMKYYPSVEDPVQMTYTSVLDNIYRPGTLEWSPDNQWLAFSGEVGRSSENGIWLFSPITKTLIKITTGEFLRTLVWSPEGREIAAISCSGYACEDRNVLVFNLKQLVQ